LNPKTTAIVLIEYQNDFTTSGGAFHEAVKGVMQANGMLGNTIAMVDKARAAGAGIMHVPISFAAGYPELGSHPYGILKGVVENRAFIKGSWGAAIVDALQPKDGDIVIEGKRGLDAFASTNLDFILRGRNIRTVALAGFLTNCCVESTMRSAYERGFEVITLTDCTATVSGAAQQAALTHDFGMFSHPMTHVEFMEALP
jgi:nicotinamidase-related amidase